MVTDGLVEVMNLATTVIRHLSTSRRTGTAAGTATAAARAAA
jgi:hypothetical protein